MKNGFVNQGTYCTNSPQTLNCILNTGGKIRVKFPLMTIRYKDSRYF